MTKFYPKQYLDKITDINLNFLKENNLKGILIDIDNTILTYDGKIVEDLEKWVENLKNNDIKICILSNTNSKEKAEKMAKKINVQYIYFAKKPLKFGFNKAKKILNLDSKNIAVVGDQVLTDVFGANRSKMYSILVKPLNEKKDIFITRINRKIEKRILQKYLESNKSKVL